MSSLTDPTFLIPTIIAVAGFVLAYEWKGRKQERRIAQALFEEVKSLKSELQKQGGLKKEEFEWKRLRDLAKAGSWLYDRLTEED